MCQYDEQRQSDSIKLQLGSASALLQPNMQHAGKNCLKAGSSTGAGFDMQHSEQRRCGPYPVAAKVEKEATYTESSLKHCCSAVRAAFKALTMALTSLSRLRVWLVVITYSSCAGRVLHQTAAVTPCQGLQPRQIYCLLQLQLAQERADLISTKSTSGGGGCDPNCMAKPYQHQKRRSA